MAEFLHGAYGKINAVASRVIGTGEAVMVVVGTAPVHTVAGGKKYVNKPVLLRSMAEVRDTFGYSDDWSKYTLCEAFHRFFDVAGVGPIVAINVLDPETHKASTETTKSLTPVNGRVTIVGAEDIIVDTISVEGKVLNTDYTVYYDYTTKKLHITELSSGGLGTAALSIKYKLVDTTNLDQDTVIGSTDNMGLNKGLYAIKNVYQETGYVPAYLLAPGWSSVKAVHEVMKTVSKKIGGHWDAWIIADLPLVNSTGTSLNLLTAATYKKENGYTAENETVCFPMAEMTDGTKCHLSVLRAVNHMQLLLENGAPYFSASNTACEDIANLYMGEAMKGRIFTDELINKYLNAEGITSATFMSGHWVLWGASAADYDQTDATAVNVGETCRMMLYHISNDFQVRRSTDVDRPMTVNDILSIVAQEQERLDAFISIGALTYAKVIVNAKLLSKADVMNGDWTFDFNVTNTPLAKSLTARVTWVDNGFQTYFDAVEAAG